MEQISMPISTDCGVYGAGEVVVVHLSYTYPHRFIILR